ncbi:MAG: methyltransferase [Pseudomonadota bacterium]
MGAIYDSYARLRDRIVTTPAFLRAVETLPFTRPIATGHTKATFHCVAGFVFSQTMASLVELDVLEKLRDGPRDTAALSELLSLSPRAVDTLMTAAAALGFVDRRTHGWGLALRGAAMLAEGGVAAMIAHHRHLYADLADPLKVLRGEGQTALSQFWTYTDGGKAGGQTALAYSHLMAASQTFVADAILHNRVFTDARRLVDLGGGAGAFAIAALKCHQNLTVTVADRPDVVPLAQSAFQSAGVDARAQTAAIDFFSDSLAFDADTVTLVRILHDHDDGPALALLTRLASQMRNARLIVAEPMATPNNPNGFDAYFPWYFMAMGQGAYRTEDALRALLRAAGYTKIKRLHSRNPTLARGLVALFQ